MRERLTARVLLFDPEGRLLLVRGAMTPGGPLFWFTVGGGVDEGETLEAAAIREVAEESGFTEIDLGPRVWVRAGPGVLFSGEPVIFKESYFVADCAGGAPSRAAWEAHEVVLMDDLRWWTLEEIAASDEVIFPERLRELAPDVAAGLYPAEPIDVTV